MRPPWLTEHRAQSCVTKGGGRRSNKRRKQNRMRSHCLAIARPIFALLICAGSGVSLAQHIRRPDIGLSVSTSPDATAPEPVLVPVQLGPPSPVPIPSPMPLPNETAPPPFRPSNPIPNPPPSSPLPTPLPFHPGLSSPLATAPSRTFAPGVPRAGALIAQPHHPGLKHRKHRKREMLMLQNL
jgi:hypothetical protein